MKIDLLYLSAYEKRITWNKGTTKYLGKKLITSKKDIETTTQKSHSDYFIVINLDLFDLPDEETVTKILSERPGEVWHLGLKCYYHGLARIMNFIRPTWVYTLDAPENIPSTSWRLSAECFMMKTEILRSTFLFDTCFDTITAIGLDWGWRLLNSGAIVRYEPLLSSFNGEKDYSEISLKDEFKIVKRNFKSKWLWWSAWRSVKNNGWRVTIPAFYKNVFVKKLSVSFLQRKFAGIETLNEETKISVFAPTLERYDYLTNELNQLQEQTLNPFEVIITDQTDIDKRENGWLEQFNNLNIHYQPQNEKGQCNAWNHCILKAKGDLLLFLGDDADDLKPDFLLMLQNTMESFKADMVACNIREKSNDYPYQQPDVFITDTFPICLVKKTVFEEIGSYDIAFNNGARADGDIAIRMHLRGKLMLLNPNIKIYHHKAPIGGLRVHGARVVSKADTKKSINLFNFPSSTEVYLSMKYFEKFQLTEYKHLRCISMMSYEGNVFKKILKIFIFFINYKKIKLKIENTEMQAHTLFNQFPEIPCIEAN